MKKQYLKSRPVCKVSFNLPPEAVNDAQTVDLLGDFNDWNEAEPIPMKKNADGSFSTSLELAAGRAYEFRYRLDGLHWENDWGADAYVPSPYSGIYNSVVNIEVPAFELDNPDAPKAPAKKAPAKKAPAKKAPAKAKKKEAGPDKLTQIEGIGPKIAGLLAAEAIDTFAKLAKAPQKKLKSILDAAGPRYKMHNPATWPEQASLAAKGKWDELKVLQDSLQGGKK